MLFTFFIASLPLGGIYLLFVYTTVYLEQFFHMDMTKGLLINGAFLLLSASLLPFFGKLGDRYGIKPLLMSTALLCALIAFPFYYMVSHENLIGTLLCEFFLVVVISFHFALISQSITGLFPTTVRFTGLAFSYNICNILIGGMVPFLSLYLVKRTGYVYIPAIVLVVLSLVTFFALIPLKQREGELDVKT